MQTAAACAADEHRLKRSQMALIKSAQIQSLASLLGPKFADNIEEALETARAFFGDDAAHKRAATKCVNELAITQDQIEANAMYLRSSGLQMMERMKMNCETSRNAIIKDHAGRLKQQEKQKRKSLRNE
jgi:hypothetical protein